MSPFSSQSQRTITAQAVFDPITGNPAVSDFVDSSITGFGTVAGIGLTQKIASLGYSVTSVAPSTARALTIPGTDPALVGTNTFGYTTPNGTVYLRPGLSSAEQVATLNHESVHSFLSVADSAPLASIRQTIGIGGYNNSAFLNATEEILAEGYASGSLRQGINHAFNGAYTVRGGTVVTPLNFTIEAGAGAAGVGGLGYGAYRLGNTIFGNE